MKSVSLCRYFFSVLVALGLSSTAMADLLPSGRVIHPSLFSPDHYFWYSVSRATPKTAKNLKIKAVDQFLSENCLKDATLTVDDIDFDISCIPNQAYFTEPLKVGTLTGLLNPAVKVHGLDEFIPVNPDLHYAAYKVTGIKTFKKLSNTLVETQLGTDLITKVKAPDILMVPASKSANEYETPDPLFNDVGDAEHYLCYPVIADKKVSQSKNQEVNLTDQFIANKDYRIKTLDYLCAAVVKQNMLGNDPIGDLYYTDAITDASNHLACYTVKALDGKAPQKVVNTTDQFASRQLILKKGAEQRLCVPAVKLYTANDVCGDAITGVDPLEGCDNGDANSDVTPDACRTNCSVAGCGDSVVDTGEDCDPPEPVPPAGGPYCNGACLDDCATQPEVCDGIDNDCDNVIDDGVTTSYYPDVDNDSYGDAGAAATEACSPPPGFVTNNTDCDDNNNLVNPAATEVCNGIDDDCEGGIDEGVLTTFYADTDNDTFGDPGNTIQACSAPSGYVGNSADCDDNNNLVNPAATEICNGIDDNCFGGIDEGLTQTLYPDVDNDTYGDSSASPIVDCPQAGYVTDNTDCDDSDNGVNPGATEVCNGVDDNCVGGIDEGVQTTFYEDFDNDGFGNPSVSQLACTAPGGFVADNTDCLDTNMAVNPGATEAANGVCSDGLDNDCEGGIDCADPSCVGFDGC